MITVSTNHKSAMHLQRTYRADTRLRPALIKHEITTNTFWSEKCGWERNASCRCGWYLPARHTDATTLSNACEDHLVEVLAKVGQI